MTGRPRRTNGRQAARLERVAGVPGLWRTREGGCNAFALVDGRHALVIDAGGTGFLKALRSRGLTLDAALLTHPEEENIRGLRGRPLRILAPVQAENDLSASRKRPPSAGVPDNYDPPAHPLKAEYVLARGGRDFLWRRFRIQALPTPGHTPAALTLLIHWHGYLLAFCGDAVAENGTLWQPHRLEWNHWSADGLRAAAEGLDRLTLAGCDILLPSHGELIRASCPHVLKKARRRLEEWIRAKEGFVRGARVRWLDAVPVSNNVVKITPWLYQFGLNGYLVLSSAGRGLVIDPGPGEWNPLRIALRDAGIRKVHALLATHFHADHAGGLKEFRSRTGAEIWLTAPVAEILGAPQKYDLPFRAPALGRRPDRILDFELPFRWEEFHIAAWDFPGQTRAHSAFLFRKRGHSLVFSGDNFFPPERWFGSGGCCAANQTCPEFYARSARRILRERPDWICAGHRAPFAFSEKYFRRVLSWAKAYRRAITQLQHAADPSGYRALPGASDNPEAASPSPL